MINELKTQMFKKKLFGLKYKFRFLKDEETIKDGDYHFKISGLGVFGFKSQESLEDYLETRMQEANIPNWEGQVLKYLTANPQEYAEGYKLILISRIIDDPDHTAIWPASSFGETVGEFPMRVFVRKI
ncbi:MAG: hypothetical protein ACRCVV_10260 [Shewanella sp.]